MRPGLEEQSLDFFVVHSTDVVEEHAEGFGGGGNEG